VVGLWQHGDWRHHRGLVSSVFSECLILLIDLFLVLRERSSPNILTFASHLPHITHPCKFNMPVKISDIREAYILWYNQDKEVIGQSLHDKLEADSDLQPSDVNILAPSTQTLDRHPVVVVNMKKRQPSTVYVCLVSARCACLRRCFYKLTSAQLTSFGCRTLRQSNRPESSFKTTFFSIYIVRKAFIRNEYCDCAYIATCQRRDTCTCSRSATPFPVFRLLDIAVTPRHPRGSNSTSRAPIS
jgi:hypothetical protein